MALTPEQIAEMDAVTGWDKNPPAVSATSSTQTNAIDRVKKLRELRAKANPVKTSLGEKILSFTGGNKIGQGLGQALAQGQNAKDLESSQNTAMDVQSNLIKIIREKKAKGEDTSRLEGALADIGGNINEIGAETESVLNSNNLTTKEVLGDALQLATTAGGGKVLGAIGGEAKAATSVGQGILQGAKTGAVGGAALGVAGGAAQGLKDNGDLATVGKDALVGGVTGAVTGGLIGGATGGLMAPKSVPKAKSDFVENLLAPEMNAKAGTTAIKTGKVVENKGLGGARDFSETVPGFNNIRSSVEKVKGINPKGTNLENVNAIHDEIGTVAQDLRNQIANQEIKPVVTQDQWQNYFKGVKNSIGENPLLVGDAEKTASKILDKFKSLLPKEGDITAENVLDARQSLDKWIKSIKGDAAFDPKTENAVSIALRAIRQGANDLIAEGAPDVAVRDLLQHQTNLYDAIDLIAPKAQKEGANAIQRFTTNNPLTTKGIKYGATAIGGGLLANEVLK